MPGIAVIGMGRSGTTFAVRALERAGAIVGEVNWACEHVGVRAVNDALLAQFGGAQIGRLPYGTLRPFTIPDAAFAQARDVIAGLEQQAFDAGSRYWAIKDPRITVLTDLWLPHVATVIALFRHPAAVVRSYVGHGFIRHPDAERLAADYWLAFNRRVADLAASHPRLHLLEYGPAMDDGLRGVVNRLELAYDPTWRFDSGQDHFGGEEGVPNSESEALYQQLHELAGKEVA